MLYPVILAGGIGSRLWPLSRAQLPKQFIQFPNTDCSLFQSTLRRLQGVENLAQPIVVGNSEHRFLIAEQLRQLGLDDSTILLEPVGRNTAPAVALAALQALQKDNDAQLLVLPADHVIADQDALQRAIATAIPLAKAGQLTTFGIVPNAPETGYGYIKKGGALESSVAFTVQSFVEKPDLDTAQAYVASGDYVWNSGMFQFQANDFLSELEQHAPDILATCQQAFDAIDARDDFSHIPEKVFAQCRSESIDYAVMEKTAGAVVVPLDAGWNDLGAWDALWDISSKNAEGNVLGGDVLTEQVTNSYIESRSRLVAAIGVTNLIVVETDDAVLIADRDHAQGVKQVVAELQRQQRPEADTATLVYRPWGSYQSLSNAPGYQVKHIIVKPGASLSLQMHHHRAEHWIVIRGTAQVVCGDKEFALPSNESTFIPLGSKHRLSNLQEVPLEIIEVQVGDYLGEDDIVRFDDIYGRTD